MITAIHCQFCGQDFEAEAEALQQICPQCGRDNFIKREFRAPAKIPVPQDDEPKGCMTICKDCFEPMSKRAFWCQKCGSVQRSRFGFVYQITCDVMFTIFIYTMIGAAILFLFNIILKSG